MKIDTTDPLLLSFNPSSIGKALKRKAHRIIEVCLKGVSIHLQLEKP